VVGEIADAARTYVRAAGDLTGADDDWQVRSALTGKEACITFASRSCTVAFPCGAATSWCTRPTRAFLAVTGNRVVHLDASMSRRSWPPRSRFATAQAGITRAAGTGGSARVRAPVDPSS